MSEVKETAEQQEPREQADEQAEPNGMAATEPNGKADEDAEYWKNRSRGWERQFKELKAERDELSGAKKQAVDEAKRADDAECNYENTALGGNMYNALVNTANAACAQHEYVLTCKNISEGRNHN